MLSVTNNSISKVNGQFKRLISKLPNNAAAILAIVVFGIAGSILLVKSQAATQAGNVEGENGTLSSAVTNVTDSSASGGHAIKFGSGAAPNRSITVNGA